MAKGSLQEIRDDCGRVSMVLSIRYRGVPADGWMRELE